MLDILIDEVWDSIITVILYDSILDVKNVGKPEKKLFNDMILEVYASASAFCFICTGFDAMI